MDLLCPILDLACAPHLLFVADALVEVSKSPRQEPSKYDSEQEFDDDDAEDYSKGNVEDDVGGDTTNGLGVERADLDNICEAVGFGFVIRADYVVRDVSTTQGSQNAAVQEPMD